MKHWCLLAAFLVLPGFLEAQIACTALERADTLWSPGEDKFAAFEVWEAGTQRLTIATAGGEILTRIVRDIQNATWTPDGERLVFAEGPVYGRPGIYSYSVHFGTINRIVDPETITESYPDGADWFEICGVEDGSDGSASVLYLHFPNLDEIDFTDRPFSGVPERVVVR